MKLAPVEIYNKSLIRALIAEAKGLHNSARAYAQIALEAASKSHSGLRYHAKLGLVENPNEDLHRRLEQIVNS